MMKKQFSAMALSKKESGVALVYALALLGLLLVMLIGFLSSSILEQRIAYNQSSQVGANLLARSALIKIKAQMSEYGGADGAVWMLNRQITTPSKATTQLIAPIVSLNQDSSRDLGSNKNAVETEAYQALEPLLNKFGMVNNTFPDTIALDFPEWINYSVHDGTHSRITGRIAYAVIPNLGIDIALYNRKNSPFSGKTIHELYDNFDFVNSSIRYTPIQKTNWLSLDFMGSSALYASTDPSNTSRVTPNAVANEFYDSTSLSSTELINWYFTTLQKKAAEQDWENEASRDDLGSSAIDFDTARKLAATVENDTDLQNQIAANLVDYMDADSGENQKPTSDVDSATWETSTPPTYTGNEKFLYLNQIVPAVQTSYVYTVQRKDLGDGTVRVTQTVKCTFQGRMWIETINASQSSYNAYVKIMLPVLNVQTKATCSGTELIPQGYTAENWTTSKEDGGQDREISLTLTQPSPGHLYSCGSPYHSYVLTTGTKTVTFSQQNVISATEENPVIKLDISSDLGFDRALLRPPYYTWYSDFVCGMTAAGNVLQATLQGDKSEEEEQVGESKIGYANFEAKDPRANLKAKDWYQSGLQVSLDNWSDLETALNIGSKNAHSKLSDESADKRDWESNDDPAQYVTAYIRNKPMQTLGELGYIHRGVPYQTLNLKSSLNPLDDPSDADKHSYANDAQILDRVKLGADTKNYKVNINAPWFNVAAFGPLVQDNNSGILKGSSLASTQAAELQKWIAYKCFDAQGSPADPTSAASKAYCYPRYVHRGMLANVITDWAKKSANAGDYATNGAKLEELIGKIVPLTRCGDTYEYFTVFAVAQTIKDVGSASGTKTIVKYDKNGTAHHAQCQYGALDYDGNFLFDEITGVSYLVARIRREIVSCENTPNCQRGIHDPACQFKVKVLESYVLNDL